MATQLITFPDMGAPAGEWAWGKTWVIEIPVKSGDAVRAEDTILTVECDKATMDVPSPADGTVRDILIKIGDTVSDATPILTLETGEANPEAKSIAVETQSVNIHPALATTTASRVFLVHGHDEAFREMTARFMEKLGLDVVILHERASEGATIIEKLEHHSQVDFAVVLLTGDDQGGPKTVPSSSYRARPRQNVVFELGYFVARLGRSRVCALYEQGVELPSDYQGIVFVEIDNRGAWRINLAKELKQAGLSVDLNKLF